MRYFFLALIYYTRIPAPRLEEYRPDDSTKALRCFSLIGIIVGLICAAAYLVGHWLFGASVGVILALAAGILATGCFHEDGFADMMDGFGGGNGKQRILEIMKDSRIGSYGVIGLILLIGTKFFGLENFLAGEWPWWMSVVIFTTIHSLARLTSGSLVFCSQYARHDDAKIELNSKAWGQKEVSGLAFFGLLPLLFSVLFISPWAILIPIPLALLLWWFKHYCEKRLQGYTGDCLGALEQLAEVVIILCFTLIVNHYDIYDYVFF